MMDFQTTNETLVTLLFNQGQLKTYQNWNKYHVTSLLFISVASLALINTVLGFTTGLYYYWIKFFRARKVTGSYGELLSLPIIGSVLHLLWNQNDLPYSVCKWIAKYGPAMRVKVLGKDFVLLNDPAMIQTVLMSHDHGHLQKPDFFYRIAFTDALSTGLVASKPDLWKAHRNIMSKSFTYEALKSYIPIINQHCDKLVVQLEEHLASEGTMKECNFVDKYHLSTFGIISHLATGTDMLSNTECTTFYEDFHRCQEIATYRLYRPWYILDLLWNFHPMKKEVDNRVKKIEKNIQILLEKQRERNLLMAEENNEKGFTSMMEVMMAAGMPENEILVEMAMLLIAGHDTVGVSLNYLMINLALDPIHQRACQEEVDKMFDTLAANKESSASSVTIESLNELKYLERCIKESMRIYPTIPLMCQELGSPLKIGKDLEVGTGVTVVISPWTLHRSPELYPNPGKFDPDRFLPENCRNRSQFAYIPLSVGPRNCLGWKLAMYEMKILAAYTLRHFEVSTNNTVQDIKPRFSVVLSTEKRINLFLKRRQ